MQVGHHDQGEVPGLDPPLAKLGGYVSPGSIRGRAVPGPEATHVLARLRGHRRVQARVHEHRPGARDAGSGRRGTARSTSSERGVPMPQHLERLEAAPGTLEEGRRGLQLAAEQGLDGHRRSLLAAGERLGQRLRFGVDLHRPVSVAGRARHGQPGGAGSALRDKLSAHGGSLDSQIFRPGLLDGQVCVVSGAGTGLGRATALELAALGATVIGCGRRPEPLEDDRERDPRGRRSRGGGADGHPRPGRGGWPVRRDPRAPRAPRRAGQQRRRPVPQPRRGDQPRRAFGP